MSLPRLSRPELNARQQAAHETAHRLGAMLGEPVRVVLTRNRKRLISVRIDRRRHRTIRMHAALAEAGDLELDVLASWIRGKPGSQEAVRTLLARFTAKIDAITALRARPPRATAVRGRLHDLLDILDEVKSAHFPEMPLVYIAWSGRLGTARRRRLGSWNPRQRLIRIHVRLDATDVPRYFVASVVHHELCHAAAEPSTTPTGRRRMHGPEFRALEEQFPDLERSRDWERAHLGRLLSE